MTTPAPVDGFFLRTPGLPSGRVVRAVRVDVAEDAPERFAAVVAARGDAARLAFDRVVWNSTIVELAAMATTIAAPRSSITAEGDVRYPLRLQGDLPSSGGLAVAAESGEGRPVIGAPLLKLSSSSLVGIDGLDPSAEGIDAAESLRRTWVLALYEELAQAGRRAVLVAPESGERAGGAFPWVVAGGVVLVSLAISAVVYGVQRAEIASQQAVELEILRAGARGMEGRLQELRRTGTMPPVTPAEEAAQAVATARANAGAARVRDAISDAIRQAGRGAGTGMLLVGGGLALLLLSKAGK